MKYEQLIYEILIQGEDDWYPLGALVGKVRNLTHQSGDDLLQASLEVVSQLLVAGLMKAGDVGEFGFVAWPEMVPAALARIEREWRALGREPSLGDICWLANTPSGNHEARLAMARAR